MAQRYNEGDALDAVLRFIEARDNALCRNDGWSPDERKNPDPDPLRRVYYVCTVGQTLHALEHTVIEPNRSSTKSSWGSTTRSSLGRLSSGSTIGPRRQ